MKTLQLGRCGLIAAVTLCCADTALAQTEARAVLQEVTVTASKTGESDLQDTPLAITAFSGDLIERSGLSDVGDLVGQTPGLYVSQNATWGQIYIRGIGTSNVFLGSDPSTTIHLDGVYLGRPTIVFQDFLDVERVEVLRGPQGTLYGRNSAGGTINVISRMPAETLEVRARLEAGNYNKRAFSAGISGPIGGDRLTGRLTAQRAVRDGYIRNLYPDSPDRELNNQDMSAVRGLLRFSSGENVEVVLGADYMREDADQGVVENKPSLTDVFGNPIVLPPTVPPPAVIVDPFTISIDRATFFRQTTYGAFARVSVDLSESATFTSLTAYRAADTSLGGDTDYTEVPGINSDPFDESQNQFSQEFQLRGDTGKLRWVAGLYYLRENIDLLGTVELPFVGGLLFGTPDFAARLDGTATTEAYAAFGQGTYSLTDRLSLTAGLRYSSEQKWLSSVNQLFLGGFGIPIGPGTGFEQDKNESWSAWTPKVGIDFEVNDDLLLYASVTRGFKSGGFNFSEVQPAFDPESVWSYEVGAKSEWFAHRLRANASAFHYEYSDLQLQAFKISEGEPASLLTFNASDATINGVELELSARPVSSVELSATVAWLDATYDRFITARANDPNPLDPVPVDVSGNRLNSAPEFTYSAAVQYELPVGELGTLSARLEYSWVGRRYFTQFNDRGPDGRPTMGDDPYGLTSAMVTFRSRDGHWTLAAAGRNLGNTVYYNQAEDFSPFGLTKNIMPPRMWGVSLSYQY